MRDLRKLESVIIEKLRDEYLYALLDIYNHYILYTTATFHSHAMTLDEFRKIVYFDNPFHQTYVMIDGDNKNVCGYVLISQHKNREAYDGTAEVTIYLQPELVGRGLGRLALNYIEDVAKKNDFHVLVATICGENARSIALFERNGYSRCAHYKEVGRKFGHYLDVIACQKILS